MSLLEEIAARRGFYCQTSYEPEDADSVFVMPMRTEERDLLVAAVREFAGARECCLHEQCCVSLAPLLEEKP